MSLRSMGWLAWREESSSSPAPGSAETVPVSCLSAALGEGDGSELAEDEPVQPASSRSTPARAGHRHPFRPRRIASDRTTSITSPCHTLCRRERGRAARQPSRGRRWRSTAGLRHGGTLRGAMGGRMVKAALRRTGLEPRDLLSMAALGAVYGVTAFLSLRLALVQDNVTPLWPPTGIAVAALLLFGIRLWPGIAVAAFFVNLPITPSPLAAAVTAAGNTIAPMAVVWILQEVGFRTELDRIRDVV